MKFSELNISTALKSAIERKGFLKPSEVQEKVIPVALEGKDIVGKSKTGTGKTAAFGIPLIEKIEKGKASSALIVTPTRELALQVKEEIADLTHGSGIRIAAVFGGESVNKQVQILKSKPEIIVGTPGRIMDLVSRQVLSFEKAKFLVLDEADKMFDMGFRDDIEKIISFFPRERQTMLFSATMPESIERLANRHLAEDRVFFDLSEDKLTVDEVDQFYIMVDNNRKVDALYRLVHFEKEAKTLVFCRTKRTVDWLDKQLYRRGQKVFALHGDKPQNVRNRVLEQFKRTPGGILIATDLVARGIHVDDIENVVNFDFPQEPETYVHRIGRTARQGKHGRAISLCSSVRELEDLERAAGMHDGVQLTELR